MARVFLKLLLCASLFMIGFSFIFARVGYRSQASGIAPELARTLNVDEDLVREELEKILERGTRQRAIFYPMPWILICVLLVHRLREVRN